MYVSQPRGYTLIELIVSVGIFSMIALTVMAAYLTLISVERQARANIQLTSSLNFAVESMARSLRTGTDYECNGGTNCTAGTSIAFTDSEGQEQNYRFIESGGRGYIGQCITTPCTDATAIPLTDSRIDIDSLRFFVRGVGRYSDTNDIVQPQVIISLYGTMTTDAGQFQSFTIQTGATQRLLDL